MRRLADKVAIVTGGGQGIGRGIALVLAKEDAAVVVADLNAQTAEAVAQEIRSARGRALAVRCDVSNRHEVDEAVAATVEMFGTVDILVNNASATGGGVPLEKTTDEDMARCHASATLGTLHCMQACFPYFKRAGGKIVNVGSAAGTEGQAGFASYAAAKEAVRALTRVAAKEWGRYQINVNAICPFAYSPSVANYAMAHAEDFGKRMAEVPLGRAGDCEEDIGRAVLSLVSPDMNYVTGMTIMVDGGLYVLR